MNDEPKTPITSYTDIVTLWGIQDSLLQQYRTIFITIQSIFISVAVLLLQAKSPWIALAVMTLLALVSGWIWITVCLARGKAVYLMQYLGIIVEQGELVPQPLKTLKDFQDGHRSEIEQDPRFQALLNGTTRKKMELYLPILYGSAWIALWAILVLQHYLAPQ